jgi:membrane associated rhomboid family serine protease/tetratricopeptide (TPR) repeat protein
MYLGFEPTSLREVAQSPTTLLCLAIITVMFVLTRGSSDVEVLVGFGAAQNSLLWKGEFWRLLTSGALHFGFWHFFFNAVVLPGWGSRVERELGSANAALIVLACTIGSSAVSSLLGNDLTSAGASGWLLGLMGATLVLEYRLAGSLSSFVSRPGVGRRFFALSLNVLAGFGLSSLAQRENLPLEVDNWGHVGGASFGIVLGLVMTSPRRRLMGLLASSVLGVLALLSCTQQFTAHGRWVARYEDALARGDFAAQIELLTAPPPELNHEWAVSELGRAQLSLGFHVEAIATLDSVLPRALAVRPGGRKNRWWRQPQPWELDARRYRAISLHSLGRFEEALNEIDTVIDADETSPWPRHVRALIYNDTNRSAEALVDLDVALSIDPQVEFYETRALARLALKDFEGAAADVIDAEKRAMPAARVSALRGWVELAREQLDGAASHFSAALELNPGEPLALSGWCEVLGRLQRDDDELIDACTRAIDAVPTDAAAYMSRAEARRRRDDDVALVVADLDRVLVLEPTLAASLLRAWIAMEEEESDALARSTALLEQFPDEAAVQVLAGEHALRRGDEFAARVRFTRALKLAPEGWNYEKRAREVLASPGSRTK